jgi:two-component system, sensor histidine kinase LadS
MKKASLLKLMKHFIEQKTREGIELKNKLILLFFISIFTLLNASNIITINYGKTQIKDFNIGFIKDTNNSININNIQESKFTTVANMHSFGNTPDTVWLKLEIKNISDIKREIFIHNDFAYFSKEITIYEYKNKKLIDQNIYKIFDDKQDNKLIGSVLVYKLKLEKQTTKTLYMKIIPTVTHMYELNIYDEKAHLEALINKGLTSNTIIITLLSLAFYNIFLYFFVRKKELVFYSLYLINASIGLSYMYGSIFHNLGIYGEEVYWINITAILVSAFLALFVKSIFNFKKENKLLHNLLNSIIYIASIDVLIALFIDLQLSIHLVAIVFFYSFVVIYFVGYTLYKQKHPLVSIFLTAYTIYIIGFAITILSFNGVIPISTYTFHASGISLVIEALLFSYLIYYHIKLLENRFLEQQNILILKNQKAQMGDMIEVITHQWKQPLSTIGSIIMVLQYKIKDKIEISSDYLDSKLTQANENIYYLSETIDDFKNFFNSTKIKTECDLNKLIQKAISLSRDTILANEITIKDDLKFTKEVSLFENELLHIVLNIIQNSKEAFRDNKIDSKNIKMIKIIGRTQDDMTYIDIIDNAGGISEENLPYIFHENYTTKEKEKGTGLGLYLSKVIIEDHMNGSIEVQNIGEGTMFRIIL